MKDSDETSVEPVGVSARRDATPFVPTATIDDVVTTAELASRSMRPRSYEVENRGLIALAEELGERPRHLLDRLAQTILDLCNADSAGVCILEEGEGGRPDRFRWRAVAGKFAKHRGLATACEESPCSVVIERNAAVLFDRPGRCFAGAAAAEPRIHEGLYVPFHLDGRPVGTLWALAHSPERRFDAEDARLLESLSRFASASYRVTTALEQATSARDESQQRLEETVNAHQARDVGERRLRLISDNVPALISSIDLDGRYRFVNERYRHWFGVGPDEIIGRRVEDVLGAEAYARRRPFMDRALAGEMSRSDATIGHPTLGERFLDVTYAPEISEEGSVTGFHVIAFDVTERRRAEQALQESEAKLAAVIDNLPVGIGVVDAAGRPISLNPEGLRIHGFASREEMYRELADYRADFQLCALDGLPIQPEDWPVSRALRGEYVRDFAARIRRRSAGVDVVVSYSALPILDERGEASFTIFVMEDVTERRRSEERLHASEREFRATFELAGSGKAQGDPVTHRLTRVNRKYCEITGFDESEMLSKTWADLTHPDDRAGDWERILPVLRGEAASWTREKRYVRKDGEIIWVMVTGSVIRDESGKPTQMIATIHDITARRLAEQAVRESEARYRAIVESQTEMVCRFDREGTILFVNGAYARSCGTTPEALVGESLWNFVEEADRTGVREMLESLSPQSPSRRIENRFVAVDGARWTLWTNTALAFDAFDRATEFQSTGIDVTALREAQEALKQADRRKDEFLAMLGHELRNPLAPIRAGLQLLGFDDADPSERRETLASLHGQVDHLVRLVDDLLDVSRIVRGRIELRRAPVELRDVIRRAQDVISEDLLARRQTLFVTLADEPTWVDGDAVRLAQVLENLLINASKYNVEEGRIELSTALDGDWIVLTVKDSGIGIEPDLLPTIFDLFTQSSRALDRSQGGLGLGLALVRNLVRLHGGSVDVRSDGHDRGSEFVVRLPRIEPPEIADLAPATAHRSRGLRTLLVDDNSAALRMLAKVVARLGPHEVMTAEDGPAALELAREFRPELALLDIGLPGMDGFEVARRFREDPALAGATLVALTGYGQAEDRLRSEQAGFDRHLVKPVSLDDLRALLAELA